VAVLEGQGPAQAPVETDRAGPDPAPVVGRRGARRAARRRRLRRAAGILAVLAVAAAVALILAQSAGAVHLPWLGGPG